MPNLSQGHVHLTDQNYEEFTKKYRNRGVFVLAVSDSSCSDCCHSESLVAELMHRLESMPLAQGSKKPKPIKVARVDVDKRYNWLKTTEVATFMKQVPMLYVFY
jgi:hypothetical protein